MILKTISIRYERKVNLGDFNSINAQMALFAQLEPGEDEAVVSKALWDMAKENVKAAILPATSEKLLSKAEIKALYLGLPLEVRSQLLSDPFGMIADGDEVISDPLVDPEVSDETKDGEI